MDNNTHTKGGFIDVSCAIIKNNLGEILVTQRSASMSLPLKWEFPGGKVEANETPQESLIREIKEELNLDISITNSYAENLHKYPSININLMPFECKIIAGTIELRQHSTCCWLKLTQLRSLDWADADVPVLENYLSLIGS